MFGTNYISLREVTQLGLRNGQGKSFIENANYYYDTGLVSGAAFPQWTWRPTRRFGFKSTCTSNCSAKFNFRMNTSILCDLIWGRFDLLPHIHRDFFPATIFVRLGPIWPVTAHPQGLLPGHYICATELMTLFVTDRQKIPDRSREQFFTGLSDRYAENIVGPAWFLPVRSDRPAYFDMSVVNHHSTNWAKGDLH
jgi:hypothetical protein